MELHQRLAFIVAAFGSLASVAVAEPTVSLVDPVYVAATSVHFEQIQNPVSFPSYVQAKRRAAASFQVAGRILDLPVKVGDRVERGDVLAKAYQPGASPRLTQAQRVIERLEVELHHASSEKERAAALWKKGFVGQSAYDEAVKIADAVRMQLAAAEAELEGLSQVESELTLHAPFDGTVERIVAEPGETIFSGQPVLHLAGDDLEVALAVDSDTASLLSSGDSVLVSFRHGFADHSIKGHISELAKSESSRISLFSAIVDLPSEPLLRAGQPVSVTIRRSGKMAASVPIAALTSVGGIGAPVVYVVRAGRAVSVAVKIEAVTSTRAFVTGSLRDGDLVITEGLSNIMDSDPVEVL